MVTLKRFKKQEKLHSPYLLRAAVLRLQRRALALIGLCLCFALPARAQVTVAPFINANPQFSDNNGVALASGCLFTYSAGTTSPLATYTDSTGSTPNSNPVILSSAGYATSGGIWLSASAYKFKLVSSGGVNCATGTTLWTQDNLTWSTPLSTFSGITIAGNENVTQPTAATGSANQSSFTDCLHGTYWTGAVSADDKWCLQDVLGTGSNPTTTWTLSHSGSTGAATVSIPFSITTLTTPSINGVIAVDGTTYAKTCAGLQSALAACSSAGGGVVDARAIQSSQACSSTITLPANCGLLVSPLSTYTSSSDPEICFSTDSWIDGGAGELSSGTFASFQDSAAGSRVLAPCTPNPHTTDFYVRGIDFWCTNAACTAPVLDLTGCNRCRFDNYAAQHSGGTGPLTLITPASAGDADYNVFTAPKYNGAGGTGAAFKITAVAASGANSQSIFGGSLANVGDCLLIDGTVQQVNQISVYGTACEAQNLSVIHTIANVTGVSWFGGRWESPTPATLFNISANSSQINVFGVGEYNTQTCGTTNSFVTIVGWPTGSPCITSGIDIFTPNNISGQAYKGQNSGVTSTFLNTANANDPLTVSTDPIANGNGLSLLDSHASGHNWRLAELFAVNHLNFRDTTQSGQPAWGFQVTGTSASEGLLTHAITANRTWTFPDQTGTAILSVGTTSQKPETGSADANVLTVTPLAVVGTYRVCATISVASATGGVISWTLSWTDSSGNAQSNIAQPLFQFGTAAPNTTFTTSAAGNYSGCSTIDTNNAAANIVVKWVGGGTSSAKMSATIERLQ